MQIIADMTLDAMRAIGVPSLPAYERSLRSACERSPPQYGTVTYRGLYHSLARDPDWMAESLVVNASAEGDGAQRLWNIAASTATYGVADAIRRHAVDESRHAAWYISILDIVFPDAADAEMKPELEQLSPGYHDRRVPKRNEASPWAYEATLDDLIQMNIAEIRTRIHHLLQRPFLFAYCRPEKHAVLTRLLDKLLLDETKHIAYTAQLIDEHLCRDARQSGVDLFHERLCDFNAITEGEMNGAVFPSCARCKACSRGAA